MDFRDLEREALYRAVGSRITVGSGGDRWTVNPDDLDLEQGLFLHREQGRLVMGRIDWIEVRPKGGASNLEIKV